jgi:uncharacterized membrane protein YeaQ/YmgE (transglycosylase-associated protein family)
MGILFGILFGLVAGGVAKVVMPGPDPLGIVGTILLGMAGALIGGLLGMVAGSGALIGFDFRSLVMAMIGSLIVLFSYRCLAMRAMA